MELVFGVRLLTPSRPLAQVLAACEFSFCVPVQKDSFLGSLLVGLYVFPISIPLHIPSTFPNPVFTQLRGCCELEPPHEPSIIFLASLSLALISRLIFSIYLDYAAL